MEIQAWRCANTNSLLQLTPQRRPGGHTEHVYHSHHSFSPPFFNGHVHTAVMLVGKWQRSDWLLVVSFLLYERDLALRTACSLFSERRWKKARVSDVKMESFLLCGTLECLPGPECVFITRLFFLLCDCCCYQLPRSRKFDSMWNEGRRKKVPQRAFAKKCVFDAFKLMPLMCTIRDLDSFFAKQKK